MTDAINTTATEVAAAAAIVTRKAAYYQITLAEARIEKAREQIAVATTRINELNELIPTLPEQVVVDSRVYTVGESITFNAGQANNMSQFNSNFALDKAGQIGGLGMNLASVLGQQADSQRADTSLRSQIGDSQYAREQQQALAPYTQQQIIADLLNGGGLLGATTGQTINSNGTSTSKESGGLLKSLLSGGFGLGAAALGKK